MCYEGLHHTMKIALCKSYFAGPVSGADETLITYAIQLRRAGHDAHVVLLYKYSESDRYYQRLRRSGVPIEYVIERSLVFMLLRGLRNCVSGIVLLLCLIPRTSGHLRRIWQILIDLSTRLHYRDCKTHFGHANYDLLHVFTPDTGTTLIIRTGHELGIPVLYHEMGTPQYLPPLHRYYERLKTVLPLCTEVAALSPRLARQWLNCFPFLNSVSVLPLITEDFELVQLAPSLRPTNEIIFGYAARIETGKGPLVLVDALAKLQEQGQPSLIRVAGTGPELSEVKRRLRELGLSDAWEFAGTYKETLGCTVFMRSLDVFVLPSFAEGTSNSVIEAMAHGLPIVASDVGGLRDLLPPEAGILVPAGDSAKLAEAMQRLASDPELRARMGKAARQRYLDLFSPNAVLPLLVKTYSRVLGATILNGPAPESANGAHPWEICENGKHSRDTFAAYAPTDFQQAFDHVGASIRVSPEIVLADNNGGG